MIKLDNYIFKKSTNKNKKYDVYIGDKKIASFGSIRKNGEPYEHFFDKIGLYSYYNHQDTKRRDLYYKRHNKNYGKNTPDWFSKKYLW